MPVIPIAIAAAVERSGFDVATTIGATRDCCALRGSEQPRRGARHVERDALSSPARPRSCPSLPTTKLAFFGRRAHLAVELREVGVRGRAAERELRGAALRQLAASPRGAAGGTSKFAIPIRSRTGAETTAPRARLMRGEPRQR